MNGFLYRARYTVFFLCQSLACVARSLSLSVCRVLTLSHTFPASRSISPSSPLSLPLTHTLSLSLSCSLSLLLSFSLSLFLSLYLSFFLSPTMCSLPFHFLCSFPPSQSFALQSQARHVSKKGQENKKKRQEDPKKNTCSRVPQFFFFVHM